MHIARCCTVLKLSVQFYNFTICTIPSYVIHNLNFSHGQVMLHNIKNTVAQPLLYKSSYNIVYNMVTTIL